MQLEQHWKVDQLLLEAQYKLQHKYMSQKFKSGPYYHLLHEFVIGHIYIHIYILIYIYIPTIQFWTGIPWMTPANS